MNMIIEGTVVNIHDVMVLPGEEVVIELPTYDVLPVGVYDNNGALLGYLGRNDVTCAPGSVTGQEICQLLKRWNVIKVSVKCVAYHRTNHLKAILEFQLEKKKQLVFN